MDQKDLDFEQDLIDSELLLKNTARSMDDDAEYSLESILAEFGEDASPAAPVERKARPERDAAPDGGKKEKPPVVIPFPGAKMPEEAEAPEAADLPEPEAADGGESEKPAANELFDPNKPVTLQDVLAQTVQEALAEREEEVILEERPKRRGLFSRKKMRDTEQLYADEETDEDEDDEEEEDIPDLPEPPAEETLADLRAQLSSATRACRAVGILTLLMWLGQLAAHFSLMPALYWDDPMVRTLPYLALELLACILGRHVFLDAFRKARGGRVTSPLLTFILCVVTLADTALYAFLPARAALSAPLPAIAVLSLYGALLGETQRLHGLYDTFRIAAIGNAPYIVTVTAGGAAKRTGLPAGFSNAARAGDPYSRWQNALLPVLLVASIVFAVLATLESKQRVLLLWNLSVLLASANLPALPMTCALPFKRIAARLAKSGSAVAGYAGASAITAARRMVVTDDDLFPPGTVSLNGLKLYGEEIGKVVSYAATAAQAAGSQLTPLFDQLLASEGGTHLHLEDLRFYEDGGIGGTIRGESVTMGSAYFMKKHHVSLPRDLKLKTGVFLAVDGQLIAIFAIKYQPSRNVEWALRAMRRNRITPVLATRSANITPALLKRKFRLDARPLYPDISTRLALSELTEGRGRPHAIIYRDGLMAFAETVIGSRRMRRAVRDGTVLSWLGGLSGLLLAYYFTSVGAFAALSALNFLCFLLLWLLTVLLLAGLVRHY